MRTKILSVLALAAFFAAGTILGSQQYRDYQDNPLTITSTEASALRVHGGIQVGTANNALVDTSGNIVTARLGSGAAATTLFRGNGTFHTMLDSDGRLLPTVLGQDSVSGQTLRFLREDGRWVQPFTVVETVTTTSRTASITIAAGNWVRVSGTGWAGGRPNNSASHTFCNLRFGPRSQLTRFVILIGGTSTGYFVGSSPITVLDNPGAGTHSYGITAAAGAACTSSSGTAVPTTGTITLEELSNAIDPD